MKFCENFLESTEAKIFVPSHGGGGVCKGEGNDLMHNKALSLAEI